MPAGILMLTPSHQSRSSSPRDAQKKCTNISCRLTHVFVINGSVLSSEEFLIKSVIPVYHCVHNNTNTKYLLEGEVSLQLQLNRLFLTGLLEVSLALSILKVRVELEGTKSS